MDEPTDPITIDLRIPGAWSHPRELLQNLPAGVRLTGEALILPDGTSVEFGALPPDDQFAEIFKASCRHDPTDEELATVENYQVNAVLSGPGGSMESAHRMMRASAALVEAGGAGVFIDNSTVAHGGQQWLAMTEDGGPDALSFAYVAIVQGKADIWTMGMHVLGLRDIAMKRVDIEKYGFDIIEVIRYLASSEKPIGDGHILADLDGPCFRTSVQDDTQSPAGSAMFNPFGRLRLESMRDIAQTN